MLQLVLDAGSAVERGRVHDQQLVAALVDMSDAYEEEPVRGLRERGHKITGAAGWCADVG